MQISKKGIDLVKKFEGCYLTAYKCPGDIWTIGYGHTKGVKPGQKITHAQAEEFLRNDLIDHMKVAITQIKITLTQNQYDAIASFCFNLGANIFTKYPKLLATLNNGQWEKFCEKLQKFCHGGGKVLPGLVKRRKAEAALFLEGLDLTASPSSVPSVAPSSQWISQVGLFKPDRAINLRTASSASTLPTESCPSIAVLGAGDTVRYNAYCYHNGHVWIRQQRQDGSVGLMATGTEENGRRLSRWGSFQ